MSLISGCDVVQSESEFYENAEKYWKSIPANLNGMLGGYERISAIDVRSSKIFLKEFIQGQNPRVKKKKALDCGAGIGRVSKLLLLPLFQSVDLAELNKDFLDRAHSYLGSAAARVGNYFCCGLQDLDLGGRRYDLIWVQWVTGHLTDEHFVKFLQQCKASLSEGGIIVIKDNVALLDVELDDQDSSVTRNPEDLQVIYSAAGLNVIKEQKQTHFPAELYNVVMTALD